MGITHEKLTGNEKILADLIQSTFKEISMEFAPFNASTLTIHEPNVEGLVEFTYTRHDKSYVNYSTMIGSLNSAFKELFKEYNVEFNVLADCYGTMSHLWHKEPSRFDIDIKGIKIVSDCNLRVEVDN